MLSPVGMTSSCIDSVLIHLSFATSLCCFVFSPGGVSGLTVGTWVLYAIINAATICIYAYYIESEAWKA